MLNSIESHYRFIRVNCTLPDKKLVEVHSCQVDGQALGVDFTFLRPLNKPIFVSFWNRVKALAVMIHSSFILICWKTSTFQVNFAMSSKPDETHRFKELAKIPRIEWCSTVSGGSKNVLFSIIVSSIKIAMPEIVHDCPYVVRCFNIHQGKLAFFTLSRGESSWTQLFNRSVSQFSLLEFTRANTQ